MNRDERRDFPLVYRVKRNSTAYNMNGSDRFVTVYNATGKVFEMPQPEKVTVDTTYYVMFTLKLRTLRLSSGFEELGVRGFRWFILDPFIPAARTM